MNFVCVGSRSNLWTIRLLSKIKFLAQATNKIRLIQYTRVTILSARRRASKFLSSFDPLGRKLKPIFSEADPFGCKNQVDVPKMRRQIKSYGCLVLLP